MKKLFAVLAFVASVSFMSVYAQDEQPTQDEAVATEQVTEAAAEEAPVVVEEGLHQALKTKFIEGGAGFMSAVVLCLILGLAIAIERIIYLSLATADSKKLLADVEKALDEGGVEKAKEICRNTRGPVAAVFYQGLLRINEGVDVAEKSIVAYGSVQSSLLERNLSWVGLFIALAPMLGFMGTVIGMISAFDRIQQAGDISATIVAGGIKVALITTVAGLIVAIILQIFYNYILSRIESLVGDLEDSSISMLDILMAKCIKK
ncbi:MAG: MotA/TolQ/ExbB proton channel family protein [Paludibacteraceae bacterium]|jgi:biopolymer transport protein ExbB|nr:MotA/TolQ/ExbB proton channel family protein [Paludibacteraceae bacterium]MBQ6765999.1 MotA/TolQ/ExbB proton channel family protein [Paludibacteraceae bacterium]MDY6373680.1 MotA/TolQ/ExbB proton channel family protein [Bacteroidales bacterium]MDY6427457.1 MotA/TolQ/ExbB proton channel family protein [Bacteroidales bacterium]